MFNSNRIMSAPLISVTDLDTYGCQPMTVRELLEEFDVFQVFDEDDEGLVKI